MPLKRQPPAGGGTRRPQGLQGGHGQEQGDTSQRPSLCSLSERPLALQAEAGQAAWEQTPVRQDT